MHESGIGNLFKHTDKMASDGFGKGSSGSSYLSVQHETVRALPCYRQLKKKQKRHDII